MYNSKCTTHHTLTFFIDLSNIAVERVANLVVTFN